MGRLVKEGWKGLKIEGCRESPVIRRLFDLFHCHSNMIVKLTAAACSARAQCSHWTEMFLKTQYTLAAGVLIQYDLENFRISSANDFDAKLHKTLGYRLVRPADSCV